MSNKLGALAEQLFTVRALQEGFRISRPIGHDSPYDFIIEKEGELFRIQVKSTIRELEKHRKTLCVMTCRTDRNGRQKYQKNAFDYFAIYIGISKSFYIIPRNKITTQSIRLSPGQDESNKFAPYFENWRLS